MTVVVVDTWTGARAAALRAALRMSNESFAEHLGTAPRTVVKWNTTPALVPLPELQRALDTALARASDEDRYRFELLQQGTGGSDVAAVGSSAGAAGAPPRGGGVVETRMSVDIDVDSEGWSAVTYRHELVNGSDRPLSRLNRELWFETTRGPLTLRSVDDDSTDGRRIMIQRVHDTASMTKFACQLLPALAPGETAVVAYTAVGGRFVYDHYWRQSIARPTGELTIVLHHVGMPALDHCTATEELVDGAEVSAAEGLSWRRDDQGVAIALTRRDLEAGQAVTLRWGRQQ